VKEMFSVYILGKVEAGTENEVLNSLKSISQVRKVSLTYGIYDLCIEALFKDMDKLDDFVFNVVRKVPGIKETVTLITSKTIFSQPSQAVSFG
jgi:DNA-binding Lrp family transcriptional regulator